MKFSFLHLLILLFSFSQGIAEEKKLVVGTSADNPPYEFLENGKFGGFDIEVIKLVAKKMNRELVIKDMEFFALVPALQSYKIDLAIANISPNAKRRENMSFSETYFKEPLVILHDASFLPPDHIDNLTIGVQLGSTYEQALQEYRAKHPIFKIKALSNLVTLIEELKNKRIDVLLTTASHANRVVNSLSGFTSTEFKLVPDLPPVESAVGMRFNDPILPEVNKAINELKASGEIDQLAEKWFQLSKKVNSQTIWKKLSYILGGVKVTLFYCTVSVTIGLILGTIIALVRLIDYKFVHRVVSVYISIFRGTPLLVQLFIIHYGFSALLGIQLSPMISGIITFGLNSSAYVSEIIRAGINSIDKGQFEAARALGIPYRQTMRDIILPQVFRRILPSLLNEVIDLLKESSLLSVIGEAEMMRRAMIVAGQDYDFFTPFLIVAGCYYVLVLLLSRYAKKLEKKLAYDRR